MTRPSFTNVTKQLTLAITTLSKDLSNIFLTVQIVMSVHGRLGHLAKCRLATVGGDTKTGQGKSKT